MDFIPTLNNVLTSTLADATAGFNYFRPLLNFGIANYLFAGGILFIFAVVTGVIYAVVRH